MNAVEVDHIRLEVGQQAAHPSCALRRVNAAPPGPHPIPRVQVATVFDMWCPVVRPRRREVLRMLHRESGYGMPTAFHLLDKGQEVTGIAAALIVEAVGKDDAHRVIVTRVRCRAKRRVTL